MGRVRARVGGILAVVLALMLGACTESATPPNSASATPSAGARLGRADVAVPAAWAGRLSVNAASVTDPMVGDAQEWLARGLMVGTPFEITAAQPLPPEGVVITRRYPVPLGPGMAATLAFFNEAAQAWQAVPSDLSPDRTQVSARVSHLSTWNDFVSGSKESMGRLRDKAGAAIRAGADFTKATFDDFKNWSGEKLAQAADWMYYAVGKVFDVRVDAPTCDAAPPDWVDSVVHIADNQNNSIRFCTGHDSKKPELLVVKARVNRGFAFTATVAPKATWRYNSTDAKGLWDQVLPWLTTTDSAMRDAVFEAAGGDPRLLVGAGEEFDLGLAEMEVRKRSGSEVLVLNPPTPLVFLSSLLGQLLTQDGMLKDESHLTAMIALAACASDVTRAKSDDVLTIAKAALTCLQSRSDDIARLVAQAMGKAGRTPKAGASAGLVARVSIYLALVGPVFSAMNYAAEVVTAKDSRNVAVFPAAKNTPPKRCMFTYSGGGESHPVDLGGTNLTCEEALAILTTYDNLPADGGDYGNMNVREFDGWECLSPTATSARLQNVMTHCSNGDDEIVVRYTL